MKDAELLGQFETCTLPYEQWTHRAHVRVAYLYLRDCPFDVALAKMRQGIQAYNAAKNVPEGEFEGYNETTTHAFMALTLATMRAYGRTFAVTDSEAFCEAHPQLMTRHVLRLFYSPERRSHPDAKTRFVEPDLAPLPSID